MNLTKIDRKRFRVRNKLKNVSSDDILCFKNAGAYCFSMSSNYNSRYKPAEVMIINNKYKLIRERERFENLLINQIDIFNWSHLKPKVLHLYTQQQIDHL